MSQLARVVTAALLADTVLIAVVFWVAFAFLPAPDALPVTAASAAVSLVSAAGIVIVARAARTA